VNPPVNWLNQRSVKAYKLVQPVIHCKVCSWLCWHLSLHYDLCLSHKVEDAKMKQMMIHNSARYVLTME
jgi:hypothetical protein